MPRKYQFQIIHGKTVKKWAKFFGAKERTIRSWIDRGTIEARINGTYTKKKGAIIADGMTCREIAAKLGYSISSVYDWIKDGTIRRRLDGEKFPRTRKLARPIYDGITVRELAEKIGKGKPVSRQRIHQLISQGKIAERLAGVNLYRKAIDQRARILRKHYDEILNSRKPGESLHQLAQRLGLSYNRLRYNCNGVKIPFAAERKALRENALSQGTEQ